MPHYFIAQIRIHDSAGYERYLDGFDQVFEKFNGTVLAVDDHPVVLEGAWPLPRTVLIRFETESDFHAWYRSPEYQRLIAIRNRAAEGNVVLARGEE